MVSLYSILCVGTRRGWDSAEKEQRHGAVAGGRRGDRGFFQMRGIMACFHADGESPVENQTNTPPNQPNRQQNDRDVENSWSNILE